MKILSILGSTGSIGTQTLDIVRKYPERFRVGALACGKNATLLAAQALEFRPELLSVETEETAGELKSLLADASFREAALNAALARKEAEKKAGPDAKNIRFGSRKDTEPFYSGYAPEILVGREGLIQAALYPADLLVNALVGMTGLEPTYAAVTAGRDVALANKETLVTGGNLINEMALISGSHIYPMDSEHSAIFQCAQGYVPTMNRAIRTERTEEGISYECLSSENAGNAFEEKIRGIVPPDFTGNEFKRILLTASGGPFRGFTRERLDHVTAKDALKHPNWTMGQKVTIDSATMMNKGLEVIEACHLFHVSPDQVEVVVHPESILHSAVEFRDGAVLAQLGTPDMHVPIAYALTYPERVETDVKPVDLFALANLRFEKPDLSTFRCLALAIDAYKAGGTHPVILNAANEVLVRRFLDGEISFHGIADGIENALSKWGKSDRILSLEDILIVDECVRKEV